MEETLHARVVGQHTAVKAISRAIRRARAGLKEPNTPAGCFLFLGPTGVGKTELAKALAEFLFDDERALARFDMSEYAERHSVAKLFGAPPGYVGHDDGGKLTEHVRRKPASVVLFDEIEKAHGDVFNVFLQIMGDGRLTDGIGRTVDFTNTVVIMTSNIAANQIVDLLNRCGEDTTQQMLLETAMPLVKRVFSPEFLNRLDETVCFSPLTRAEMGKILELQLAAVAKRLSPRQITLEVAEPAKLLLLAQGYDPQYGARPLKRTIARLLSDPLAEGIMDGSIPDSSSVLVDAADGELTVKASTFG